MGLYTHLQEAIAVNRARQGGYAVRSEGASVSLSALLIGLERAALPLARLLDRWARPFHQQGLPIGAADFVPMERLPPPGTPPGYRRVMDRAQHRLLIRRLRTYRWHLLRAVAARDWPAALQASLRLLDDLQAWEAAWQVHLAMSLHLTESIALSVQRAPRYAAQSDQATEGLSTALIGVQALPLPFAPALDRRAQRLHRIGVGILVNDLPAIAARLRTDPDPPAEAAVLRAPLA